MAKSPESGISERICRNIKKDFTECSEKEEVDAEPHRFRRIGNVYGKSECDCYTGEKSCVGTVRLKKKTIKRDNKYKERFLRGLDEWSEDGEEDR